jgi:Tol biopolymer transport system component
VGEPGRIWDFSLSPDDKRAAVVRADQQLKTSDIWIRNLERGLETRFTSNASLHSRPIWSPDGTEIVFSSTRAGRTDLYSKPSSGTVQETVVMVTEGAKFAMDVTRDGKAVLYNDNGRDVFAVALTQDPKPIPVLHSEFGESQPQLSADNRWLAYVSDESGRNEVYVQPFTADGRDAANRWPISSAGGTDPRWRRDGKELFFLGADGRLMSVAVKSATVGGFSTDPPEPLFEIPPISQRIATNSFRYSVTSDGQRFLVVLGPPEPPRPLTVITNWQSAVKR